MKHSIVTIFLFINTVLLFSQNELSRIKLNQVGYYTHSEKIAIVPKTSAKYFYIKKAENGEIVYKGVLSEEKKWAYSQEDVKQADFSEFNEPGKYFLSCDDYEIEKSFEFRLEDNLYQDLAKSSLHGFYLARVSTPVLEEYAGIYKRAAGHPDDKVIIHNSAADQFRPEGTAISSPGGWYDAGDYNKYIVNSGITTFTLLHIYELFPEYFSQLKLSIPENNNKVPDILDEVLWNLRWMLTMQDPNDGGVYHKLTNKGFDGFIQPVDAVKPRYVVAKSTSAALNLTAVCAKAYRIFNNYENEYPGLADSCLNAAEKAWKWAKKNPQEYYIQPQDIITGAYDDFNMQDEFAWASMEIFLSTKDKSYLPDNLEAMLKYDVAAWKFTSSMGLYSLFNQNELSVPNQSGIQSKFLENADRLYNMYDSSAYKTSIDSLNWGSNAYVASQGIYLMVAYRLTDNEKYLRAAESALHYILGNNATGYCFVIGFGTKYPVKLHDRRSGSDNIDGSIPGYLAGGPTNTVQSDCGEDNYPTSIPALSYIDEECSYSTNEIAINWQAALVFLVNFLEAEQSQH